MQCANDIVFEDGQLVSTYELEQQVTSYQESSLYVATCAALKIARNLFWGNRMHLLQYTNVDVKETAGNVVTHCLLCMLLGQSKDSDITNSCQASPGGEKAMEGRPNSAPGPG